MILLFELGSLHLWDEACAGQVSGFGCYAVIYNNILKYKMSAPEVSKTYESV